MTTKDESPQAPILVVDDEPDILEVVDHALRRHGYRVITAGGGREAAERFGEVKPRLVLTDVRMAGGNGHDLAMQLRARTLDTPILFMTGFSDISAEAAFALGVNGLVFKPFDFRVLAKLVAWHALPPQTRLMAGSGAPEPTVRAHLTAGAGVQLGRGGVFVTDHPAGLAEGDGVTLALPCSEAGGKLLRGRGVCRWTRGVEAPGGRAAGIEFLELDDESRAWFLAREARGAAYIPAPV